MNLTEPQDLDETDAIEERKEVDELDPELWERIDEAIGQSEGQPGKDFDPLFMLANAIRSVEEELGVRFSVDPVAQIAHRWEYQNREYLSPDHDYATELLDKLSLVRFPKGRTLLRAVELATKRIPPKQTAHLSADVQLLACLCAVLQDQAGNKPFFLDGRSAATALGKPHETVASWLRGLCYIRLIKLVSKGHLGTASRYRYIA